MRKEVNLGASGHQDPLGIPKQLGKCILEIGLGRVIESASFQSKLQRWMDSGEDENLIRIIPFDWPQSVNSLISFLAVHDTLLAATT